MDSPVLTLISAISGILVVLVESRVIMSPAAESSPPHERFLSSPPPPTSYSPPPPPPPRVPNLSTATPRPRSKHTAVKRPPPPPPPPPLHKPKLNLGKEIGIMFCGAVVILQIGVLAFLLIRRRQILKNPDRY